MAAGGKASKSARKYKATEKKVTAEHSSSKDSIDQTEDIRDSEDISGCDKDTCILAVAVIANVGILMAALAFWFLYATCGSVKVTGPATEHTASTSVTSATTIKTNLALSSSTTERPAATEHIAASSVTPVSTTTQQALVSPSISSEGADTVAEHVAPGDTSANDEGSSGTDSIKTGSDTGGADASDADLITKPAFECGVPETAPDLKKGRIVGGAEAVPYSWPYTVGLGLTITLPWNGQTRIIQKCGATLLSPRYALSAAHCFDGDPDLQQAYSIFARFHDRNTYEGVITERVETVHLHPLNNIGLSLYLQYDFAVLELESELQPEPGLKFACLPPLREEKPEGTICWAVGWGSTQDTGAEGLLKQVAIDIVSEATCKWSFSSTIFKESTLCGGTTAGQDTCQGDSGGPLYCFDDGKWYIYGVTSYGPSDCGAGPMAAYGSVSFNIEWICCFMPSIPSCAGVSCLRSGDNRE